jgi:hypothetical protein
MSIKQTDIRLMELTSKLSRVSDRMGEINGEMETLHFKLQHGELHPILLALKINALNFEMVLLKEESDELIEDYKVAELVREMGLDFIKEDF